MYCKFTAKIKNKQENYGGKWRENRLKSDILSRSARKTDLPASLITYTLQRAIPSARGSSTAPSPRRSKWKSRNINRVSHRHRRSAET